MKWKKSEWYTLCLECFAKYHKQGGYCPADRNMKCSLCREPAVAEFYPSLHRRLKSGIGKRRKL